ncbi:hypothetical protein CHUAL_013478 [Chamberlinius hualienensis]
MANDVEVKMSVNSKTEEGAQIEEPLVEIKKLNKLTGHLSFNKQLKVLKILTAISSVIIIILFVYFNSRMQNDWTYMINKIEELKLNFNKTQKSKYLNHAEGKFKEFEEAIETFEKYEKQHNVTDDIWAKYPVIEWNTTNLLSSYSPMFPLSGYNLSGRIVVKEVYPQTYIYMEFINFNQSSKSLTNRILSEVMYTLSKLKTGKSDLNTEIITSSCNFKQATLNNTKHFIFTYDPSYYRYTTVTYNFKLFLLKPQITSFIFSYNGILSWKINTQSMDFEKQSPYFYSHPNGYKMKLKLHQKYGFDFSLYIVCGENDDSLPSEFPFKTTFTVFYEENIWKNLVLSRTYHNGVSESPINLITFSTYDWNYYISKDNTILVKLEVELLNIDEE